MYQRSYPFTLALLLTLATTAATQSTLDNLIAQIRPVMSAPGWIDNYTPDGVLHDYGVALWEMPTTYKKGEGFAPVDGGGYLSAIRRLHLDPSFYLGLHAYPLPGILMAPQDWATVNDVVYQQDYSRLNLPEIGTMYNAGTSLALQNMVFAPYRDGAAFTFHAYPEVNDILQAANAQDLTLYGNIGFQNNNGFLGNEYEFNARYGQRTKDPDPVWTNPALFNQTAVADAHIDPRTYLLPVSMDAKWGLSPTRAFMKPTLDVTHPTAIQLCQAHLRQVAQTWGTQMRFYVGGEYFISWPRPTYDSTDPPITDYSPRAMSAFQAFMSHFHGGFEIINARWGLGAGNPNRLTKLGDIGTQHVDPTVSEQAVRDFHAMNLLRTRELRILQYATAKAEAPQGAFGSLTQGMRHLEVAGLTSDFPATGDWIPGQTEYFQQQGNELFYRAAGLRLTGTPVGFGITAPPTSSTTLCTLMTGFTAPGYYQPNCYETDLFEQIQRDTLIAGSVHHGYIKAPAWSTYGFPESRLALLGHVASVKAARPDKLRFMTPYHRVTIHMDEATFESFPGTESVASRLADRFARENTAFAHFSDRRHLRRLFGKEQLGRGVLISAFHGDLDAALMQEYEAIAAQVNPQPGVLVLTDMATYSQLSGAPLIPLIPNGGIMQWKPNLNLFVAVFADSSAQTTEAALEELLPLVFLAITPELPKPITVTEHSALDGRVESSYVSDGINYYVAVSNRSSTMVFDEVTVDVDTLEKQRTAAFVTGYTISPAGTFSLAPKETKFLFVGATLQGESQVTTGDITQKVNNLTAALAARGQAGFDVAAGQRLLQYIGAIDLGTYKGRAITGLARLENMLFLKANRSGAQITVTCVRSDGTAVAGAEVQSLNLVNGHERQDVGLTNAAGVVTFTVAGLAEERWDFFQSAFVVPTSSPVTDLVEVHVHDPATGSQTFLAVDG